MAPPKKRATTLQEKFGFVDDDLKKPQHDAMLVWIDQRAEEIAREFFGVVGPWPEDLVARVRSKADEVARTHFHESSWKGLGEPPGPVFEIVSKVWELPVMTSKEFAVGFADLVVRVSRTVGLDFTYGSRRIEGEDLPISWSQKCVDERLVFEAKTEIPSAGELIRQIRLYQEYLNGRYIVVSPDDKFADLLRSQGIEFMRYEG